MGAVSIDTMLPWWAAYIAIALILLMAVGLIICILRDIAEMRVLWAMEQQAVRDRYMSGRRKTARPKKPPSGMVDLEETWIRPAGQAVKEADRYDRRFGRLDHPGAGYHRDSLRAV